MFLYPFIFIFFYLQLSYKEMGQTLQDPRTSSVVVDGVRQIFARIKYKQFMFLQTTETTEVDICTKHDASLTSWLSHLEAEGKVDPHQVFSSLLPSGYCAER